MNNRLSPALMALAVAAACATTAPGSNSTPNAGDPSDAAGTSTQTSTGALAARAAALCASSVLVDTHIDAPNRLEKGRADDGALTEDVTGRTAKGDFDLPRALEGGLDAAFMSIYVPAKHQTEGGAKALADKLIDMVEGIAASTDRLVVATSPAEVRAAHAKGQLSLPLGIENGAAIESDLANLEHFARRGVRYITLTHSKDNAICDSSYDDARTHQGLSPFGKQVVTKMNDLGVMVDISHVSDDAFWQTLEVTKTPVIASHSSCRHFTPGFERNMSDDMIRALAKNGGVIQINFGSTFVDADLRKKSDAFRREYKAYKEQHQLESGDPKLTAWRDAYRAANPQGYSTVQKVADHIDHVRDLVGIDHVGIGSDYDGVGDSLPTGLKDVASYPNLVSELLRRGYRDEDIKKVLGENLLRVWSAVQEHAAKS